MSVLLLQQQQQQQRVEEEAKTTSTKTTTGGCIVVVAKCPIPGKSKTRLVPLLGEDGSSKLAKAMLSDVLLTLEHCPELSNVTKVLLYAPGDETGFSIMKDIMKEIGIDGEGYYDIHDGTTSSSSSSSSCCWRLLPMISPNLQSSDLGDILQHALDRVVVVVAAKMMMMKEQQQRNVTRNTTTTSSSHGVVFLGMDSPEIPLPDIVKGLKLASNKMGGRDDTTLEDDHCPAALLCPSDDGGYGMLCVPSTSVDKGIFQNVYWSHSLTAVSQLKALTDAFVPVVLGRLMHDIDEPEDVHKLCQRLSQKVESTTTTTSSTTKSQLMGLERYSSYDNESLRRKDGTTVEPSKVESKHEECKYTKLALKELGLLVSVDEKK